MFDTGETLEDIERWAEATFPDEFKTVKDYLRDNKIVSEDCDHEDGNTHLPVRSVTVGDLEMMGGSSVIAHFTSDDAEFEPRMVLCSDSCHDIVWDYHVDFEKPFCWFYTERTRVRRAQFDAFIKFICSPSAMPLGVINTRHFKEHFEGACRFIAGKLEEQRRPNGKCNQRFYFSAMTRL